MSAKTSGGYWQSDAEYGRRLDTAFEMGEPFLVFSVEQDTPFIDPNTKEEITTRSKLRCQALDLATLTPIGLALEYKTLASTIYDRAALVTAGDFPAVVTMRRVPVKKFNNEALIMEQLCPWPIPAEMRGEFQQATD
jgi:hypothetical protein